jgi:N-carbamoylputrescine amidase
VNNVFVAAANRVGQEGRITFWGGSFVLDPSSRIVAQAGCAEDIVMTTCDLGQVQEMQEAWRFLKVRSYARA